MPTIIRLWQVNNPSVLPRCSNPKEIKMDVLLDVVRVDARHDYTLLLEFENGEKRVFDMAPLMDKKPFVQLKGLDVFTKAAVDYGTVVWPGNIDIAPETLYDRSRPV